MADVESKMKERIRRMLALSEDMSTTQAERDHALSMASELMTKHQIERAMIDLGETRREKIAEQTFTYVAPYTMEKSTLLGWTASALGLRSVLWARGKTASHSTVYGYESDLELLDMLYTSLLLQQAQALKLAQPPYHLYGAEVAAWRRDWMRAFISAAVDRVRLAHQREVEKFDQQTGADSGSSGAALVLASRADAVAAHVAQLHPKLGKPRKLRALRHVDAVRQGYAAGSRADVGMTRVGEQRHQIG